MVYEEEDYLQISGIQHFLFCRRQWALIHVENQWAENYHTADGHILHKHVHDAEYHTRRKNILTIRGMRIHSSGLGISGECDVVEFQKQEEGISLSGYEGFWMPYPIEYKRGKKKEGLFDVAQLCAQAMCLEEMLCCTINEGALYYFEARHREVVAFTEDLRSTVKEAFGEMHEYMRRGYTPKVKKMKSCRSCSLNNICVPEVSEITSVSEGRKKVQTEWQKRKKTSIVHPFLKEQIEWGLVPYAQALLLARFLREDLDGYPPFLWK